MWLDQTHSECEITCGEVQTMDHLLQYPVAPHCTEVTNRGRLRHQQPLQTWYINSTQIQKRKRPFSELLLLISSRTRIIYWTRNPLLSVRIMYSFPSSFTGQLAMRVGCTTNSPIVLQYFAIVSNHFGLSRHLHRPPFKLSFHLDSFLPPPDFKSQPIFYQA